MRAGLLAAASLALALPATAAAQDHPLVPMSATEASQALEEALAAIHESDPHAVDPTVELRDLLFALPSLEGPERRQARMLLRRPPSDHRHVSPGGHFVVHWVDDPRHAPRATDTSPANGVPDYVDRVAARAETSRAVENGTLGWPPPKSDGAAGGEGPGLTDIYLRDLCTPARCIFGYADPEEDNTAECVSPPFRCAAFVVLDNDYARGEFGYLNPNIPLSVTLAHEYNHVLQFAIDTIQDGWMLESTAVWAEEKVFPAANDWLASYMGLWAKGPNQPITDFGAQGGLRVYGTAVWNHWLERGGNYGHQVVLDSWLNSRDSDPKDFAAGAYDLGIRDHSGRGFAREFAEFAAATAEWRVTDGNFPDEAHLPDVEREGRLRRRRTRRVELDHTAYRLVKVKPGAARRIRLVVEAPRRVRTGIALVGRTGTPTGGSITQAFDYLPRGREGSVRLQGVRKFERITAVIANADGRVRRWGGLDWDYSRDNERFRVSLR